MIYADYNGSAPLCNDVKEYLINRLQENGPYANPNAIHYLGSKTLMGMENARSVCAKVLGADYGQVIFNSGATEGISTVFHHCLNDAQKKGIKSFIISGIEHSAVVNSGKYWVDKGLEMKVLPTLENGIIDLNALSTWLADFSNELGLVAIMAANNETGIIQPFEEISRLCQEHSVPFLCDTTQYIGKTLFNFKQSGIDFALTSGHKFGALTGTGILLCKNPSELTPFIIGGGQEKGKRGGTQNYIGNETLAVALKSFEESRDKVENLNNKRLEFEKKIKEKFPEVVIIGESSPRLASTTYLAFPGIHGQAVQIELESDNIFVTTSSACSDNEPVTSKVLKAMNVTDEVGRGVVRISLGLNSPLKYYDTILTSLTKAYEKLGKIKSY